jgi:NTE family protein
MAHGSPPVRPPSYDKKIGLVLQGGGALGSYQAGVYEALASSEYLPDCVAGISIGAINAAIIVGNTPENRVKHLRNFWQGITAHTSVWPSALGESFAAWRQKASAMTVLMFGQPGFFTPRTLQDWFSPGKLISYYDISALKGTLERLVDFDRINNAQEMRSAPSMSWPVPHCRRAFRPSRSTASIIGTEGSFLTRRCNTCWTIHRAVVA